MKKPIYFLGFICCILILTGTIFKINHWPGAGPLLVFGIVILCLWFLPAALINNYKGTEKKQSIWLYLITYITALILFTGVLFKIMHWPGASYIIYVSVPFPFVVFLPVFLYHTRKHKNVSLVQSIFVIFLLAYISVTSAMLSLRVAKEHKYNVIMLENDISVSTKFFKVKNDLLLNKFNSSFEKKILYHPLLIGDDKG